MRDRIGLAAWLAITLYANFAWADCQPSAVSQTVSHAVALDGDSLRLADGSQVRLLGVNTPERGQPLAAEALAATQTFIRHSRFLLLEVGQESHDRYGRQLAMVFDDQGQSLSALLLEQGLGWHVAIAPNLAWVACLRPYEQAAKQRKVGVWLRYPAQRVSALASGVSGFQRLQGKVTAVEVRADALLLSLDTLVELYLTDPLGVQQGQAWLGKQVEVRGWLIWRGSATRKRWRMQLSSLAMLESH